MAARLSEGRGGLASLSTGVSSGDAISDASFWFKTFGGDVQQDSIGGVEGYDASIFGMTLGYDAQINPYLCLGIAGGISEANTESTSSQETRITSYQGVLYGSFDSDNDNLGNHYYIDAFLAFSSNDYQSTRSIYNGDVATGNYAGRQTSSKVEVGYTIERGKFEFTPLASLEYTRLRMDPYTEKGSDAWNLSVEEQGEDVIKTGIGFQLSCLIETQSVSKGVAENPSDKWIPTFRAVYLYDSNADVAETTASFVGGGDSFITQGADVDRSSILLGAGLAFLSQKGMSLTGNYSYEHKEGFSGHAYDLTLRVDF